MPRRTRNLKLIVDDNLSPEAKYNLERIDAFAGAYNLDSSGNLIIRSRGAISIEPNSRSAGGTGEASPVGIIGTSVSIPNASATNNLTLQNGTAGTSSYSFTITLSANTSLTFPTSGLVATVPAAGVVRSTGSALTTGAVSLTADVSGVLPTANGGVPTPGPSDSGKVLTASGGSVTWQPAGTASTSYSADWLPGDGPTKTVTHGLGTTDVLVSIRDENGEQILLAVDVLDNSTVSITSSEAPSGTWRVTITI